jgi:proteasome lid subunit RPN8/RPN11
MFSQIILHQSVFIEFQKYADSPYEVCGIMLGRVYHHTARVYTIRMMKNIAEEKEVMFEMDTEELLFVLKQTTFMYKNTNDLLDLCGIIHTHPNGIPPVPSLTDFRGAVGGINTGYVIYSPERGLLNAYYWQNNIKLFQQIEIIVE